MKLTLLLQVSESPCFVPNAYGDRFIPRRYNCENQHFLRPTLKNSNNHLDNDILFMVSASDSIKLNK